MSMGSDLCKIHTGAASSRGRRRRQSGSVMVFDVRRSNEPVVSNTNFTSKQIYRMKFSTLRPNLFAVSVDNVSLHVLDLDQQFTTLNVK